MRVHLGQNCATLFSLTGSLRGRLTLRVKLFRDRIPSGTGITPHRGCDKEKKYYLSKLAKLIKSTQTKGFVYTSS